MSWDIGDCLKTSGVEGSSAHQGLSFPENPIKKQKKTDEVAGIGPVSLHTECAHANHLATAAFGSCSNTKSIKNFV